MNIKGNKGNFSISVINAGGFPGAVFVCGFEGCETVNARIK